MQFISSLMFWGSRSFQSLSKWNPCLISICLIFWLGCERVRIFADPARPTSQSLEIIENVGVCVSDDDCPQWACITSTCQEGLCIPKRREEVSLTAEERSPETRFVSVSLRGDELVGLLGTPDPELSGPHSLGLGDSLKRWKRDQNQWSDAGSWSPELVRVTLRPALTEDREPQEIREELTLRGVTLGEDGLWLHAGDDFRHVWYGEWNQSPQSGHYHRLAAPLQSIATDGDEVWVAVFDKGLERLEVTPETSDDELTSFEANARFNTPGRALAARAGRSFVLVADGYAGLSLFNKRADSGLGMTSPARRLITPPQELATEGRVVHLDVIEDRVVSAELGIGVGISRITPEGGLEREMTFALGALGGSVQWVSWIDPYTPLIWVEGEGLVVLDLLSETPTILTELSTEILSSKTPTADLKVLKVAVWSAHQADFAFLSDQGTLFQGSVTCQ